MKARAHYCLNSGGDRAIGGFELANICENNPFILRTNKFSHAGSTERIDVAIPGIDRPARD